MNKKELVDKIKDLDDDAEITSIVKSVSLGVYTGKITACEVIGTSENNSSDFLEFEIELID